MSKTKTKRPTKDYSCKPHKVPYLKQGKYENVDPVTGKNIGWNDAPTKLKTHMKSARMKQKLALKFSKFIFENDGMY